MRGTQNFFLTLFLLLTLSVGLSLVSQKTNFFQRAFGTDADLKIDFGTTTLSFGDSWKNLAQGGEEKGRMLSPVIGKVKKLNLDYIRIDHVYDYYNVVSRGGDGELVFNWAEFDLVIGDILATGAKPFISLSYMPLTISKGDVTDIPNNWSQWEEVIQKTIEHVSGRKELNINNVYYEVWNEPDLFGEFKPVGGKNYMDLYSYASAGARKAENVNEFKFGGPSTTDFYQDWITRIIEVRDNGSARVDFISWHKYSKDLDDIESQAGKAQELGMETVISEFGINSENDEAYDGKLSAIHTLASAAIFDGKVSKLFNFEIKDGPGPEKFWGRWGILTHEKWGEPEEKMRFRALEYLNQMIGVRAEVLGEGSWVKAFARRGSDYLKILIVNYDSYGTHPETVPISFSNIPTGSFTLKERLFLGGVKESVIENTANTWSTSISLNPNSATVLELNWK